jgi:hypothetical protein
LALLVGLPAVYVGGFATLAWSSFNKPWLFVLSSIIFLYLLYFAAFYFFAPSTEGYNVVPADQLQPGAPGHVESTYTGRDVMSFIGEYVKPILVFTVAAAPTLWLLARLFRR